MVVLPATCPDVADSDMLSAQLSEQKNDNRQYITA